MIVGRYICIYRTRDMLRYNCPSTRKAGICFSSLTFAVHKFNQLIKICHGAEGFAHFCVIANVVTNVAIRARIERC